MALLETPQKDNDFTLVDFALKGTDGKIHTLADCVGKNGTLVLFICNHCPYVRAVIDRLVEDCRVVQEAGIGVVAIMPNDAKAYPADSFDAMKHFAKEHRFSFPYLIDETQDAAKAYGAVCTPDIFGFNADGILQYRGRVDSAGAHEADAMTKRELREAMLEIAKTGVCSAAQTPSMGCSIKWKK